MKFNMLKNLWIALLAVALATTLAWGADLNAIKQRMKDRLPAIKTLKIKGIVGENNQGYLEFVGPEQENASVVAEENADRRKVYEAIARQQNVSLNVVELHRAAQIHQNADPGLWLQSAGGEWYKKQ